MPVVNKFQIDEADVAGMDIDSRHLLLPDPSSKRVEHFPASRVRYAIKAQPTYGTLIVYGPLRAATPEALYTLIDTHIAAAAAVPLVRVTFHTKTWTDCDFYDFRVTGRRVVAYKDSTGEGVKIDVEFVFMRLAS